MGTDSNLITREYYDKILVQTRYIDADLPDMNFELFGRTFDTPIATAALSHLNGIHEKGMTALAKGAAKANAVNFCGMESYDGEIDDIMTAKAATVRIIKPHADNADVLKRIEHTKELNVFAMGMDIDHAFRHNGEYDLVEGLPMKPKSLKELESFVKAAGDIPFVIKGVLSVEDALKCLEIGVKGIVVSHHHGIMPSSVPPVMVLPEIAKAVKGKMTIFVDCGIESGMDAYKAIALGADAVCLGRALMDPLKENGSDGVAQKITDISNELKTIMARTGFKDLKSVDDKCLRFL